MKIVLITGVSCFKSLRVITWGVAALVLWWYLGLNIAALISVKISPAPTLRHLAKLCQLVRSKWGGGDKQVLRIK